MRCPRISSRLHLYYMYIYIYVLLSAENYLSKMLKKQNKKKLLEAELDLLKLKTLLCL